VTVTLDHASGELQAELERVIPRLAPAGTRSVAFCLGTCFHPTQPISALDLVVGERRCPATAFGMPRRDVARGQGRRTAGYRSGFWATIPLRDLPHGVMSPLQVAVTLADGQRLIAPLGHVDAVDVPPLAALSSSPGQTIAVCMATFEPNLALFTAQVESLRAQTDRDWVCVISDDCSEDACFEGLQEVVGSDSRFIVSRSRTRLGFYGNFERAMRMAPPEAGLIALCDQDDYWHADKLEVLRRELGDSHLVYSDQRMTDEAGRVLRDTFWRNRANNSSNLASQLVANTITGAAMLMRRELADLAIPFPQGPGFMFHDHWIGALAIASGPVAYVDRPLYDYVQHGGAVLGNVSEHSPTRQTLRMTLRRVLGAGAGWFVRWRAAYFYGYTARVVLAETLLLRCEERLTPLNHRVLTRYIACERSLPAFLWLALRPLRTLVGRNETLGSELDLVRGILWRRLCSLGAAMHLPSRLLSDATLPDPVMFQQRGMRRWRAKI
jgi:glycosyltransferase involved in cell wall biosynthesis